MTNPSTAKVSALLLCALGLACKTRSPASSTEPPGSNGHVAFRGTTTAHTSATQSGSTPPAPVICGTLSLQPVSIDAAGHQTIAGPPVVFNTNTLGQTDQILGCIDVGGAIDPNWGYLVTATDFVDCATGAPRDDVFPKTASSFWPVQCVESRDAPLAITIDVSIAVPDSGGYVDISAGVDGTNVTLGCKSAETVGNFLHFGESAFYATGGTAPLAFTGIGESDPTPQNQSVPAGAVQQFDGIVSNGTQDDAFFTGLLALPPAGSTAEVLQTFAQSCPSGSYYAGASVPQCDLLLANGTVTNTARLADLFAVVPGGLWFSASITGPSELTITSGSGALTSNATALTTAWNPATTQQQKLSLGSPISGIYLDLLAPGSFFVVLDDLTYAQISATAGVWQAGAFASVSTVAGAQLLAMGLFQPLATGCHVPCDAAAVPFGGGSGSSADPYLVCSRAHLANVATALSASFKQVVNLDLSDGPFAPLGTDGDEFLGSYDGNGFTIANFTYVQPTQYSVGLFAHLGLTGAVKNLTLRAAHLEGRNRVGGIAARSNGAITNVTIAGGTFKSAASVGAVVGEMSEQGSVLGVDNLIDRAVVTDATIYSSANDSTNCDCAAAGIAGTVRLVDGNIVSNSDGTTPNGGRVTNSSTSNVSVEWDPAGSFQDEQFTYAGGLVGYFAADVDGLIADSHVNGGTVTGRNDVGGVVGRNEREGTVRDCSSSADVTGVGGDVTGVGGVTGWASGPFLRTSSSGSVTGVDNVGGLMGVHYADAFSDSFSTSAVSASGDGASVGGIVGLQGDGFNNGGDLRDCYFAGSVTASGSAPSIGGGVGRFIWGTQETLYSAATAVTATAGTADGFLGKFAPSDQPASWSDVYFFDNAAFPLPDPEAAPLDAAGIVTEASFVGFDFTSHWKMPTANPGSALAPVLAWQCGVGGVVCAP